VKAWAAGALGALAVATVFAGIVVQRAKDAPALLRAVRVTRAFTPNGDGHRDVASIRLRLGRRDRVTVTVLDADGRPVRRLVSSRPVRAGGLLRALWNGRTDAGAPAPAGVYRVRVALPRGGRTIELTDSIRLLPGVAGR
jgi:flagellar hook capping protein FlgD